MPPLLSVVIPTWRRPSVLGRSISSAFLASPDGDVEVVVVPNGPAQSWKEVAKRYTRDQRVKWFHLKEPNACAARNHGMEMASGKYIRFLDDDDTLYPTAAQQLFLLESSGADLSSGPLRNVWGQGLPETIAPLPTSNDYVAAALLSIGGMGFNQGTVFLRSALQGARWPESATLYDDYLWLLETAKSKELTWLKLAEPVASYFHHRGERLSYLKRSLGNSRKVVESILELHTKLTKESRCSSTRTKAAATALLSHAHSAFPACPVFLSRTIKKARTLDESASPTHPLFSCHSFLSRHQVAAEWAMLLPRYLSRGYRRLTWRARQALDR